MRQKVPYGVFGFFCGLAFTVMVVTPVLQYITGRQQSPIPGLFLFLLILILGIIGTLVGLKVDKFMNDRKVPDIIQNDQNFITRHLYFLASADRKVEGNKIIYTGSLVRYLVNTVLFLSVIILTGRYVPKPFGNFFSWMFLIFYLVVQIPQSRDKTRAVSKKTIKNTQGKTEIWYEMAKNE